jgi:serine/threonine protein kinase/Flp pilus assembly protein TadD
MNDQNDDKTHTHVVLTKGTMVSHYRIVEKIGVGGMGEVYLAEDTNLKRRVALKLLPSRMVQDEDTRIRFAREAQAAAKLDHPNIVTIYEVDEYQDQPFLAMQYVEGRTLHHYCHEASLSLEQIASIGSDIAAGLSSAHSAGVVHRDIKASNIILDNQLRPKILDFGLATIQGGEMLTKTGSTLGTVAYMSPEQVQGHEADHRSDIFSLGVVLYELVTRRTPFKRNSDAASLQAILNDTPEPMARYKADVLPELQRLVDKSLSKNPSGRYQSAADLSADLRRINRTLSSGLPGSSQSMAVGKPSLAVLPFANMSADPENEYFSDGLTEELLNVLAKNPELKVTGRTSSFAFKDKREDLRVIGQKLGVGTLLEGSVRKAGNRVRITAQLVSVADGFHLWSETYDRILEDIFAVQDEIAAAVAKELHVTLLGSSGAKRAVDPESYQLTLRAHELARMFSETDLAEARKLYDHALEIDPDNAAAIAGLGRAYIIRAAYGFSGEDALEDYRRAKKLAKKALNINPELHEAHQTLGWVRVAFEYNFDDGYQHFKMSYDLAPNSADTIGSLGVIVSLRGDFEEGSSYLLKALELDPLNPETYMNYGRSLLWAGREAEAEAPFRKALELSPGMASIHLSLGWVYLLQGRPDEALGEMKQERSTGYQSCGLAMVYHALGRAEESREHLDRLINEHRDSWSVQVATVCGYIGDVDKAFEWLEKSVVSRDAGVPLVGVSPFFTALRDDPRWPRFLKRIGLAD